ncbi:Os06g0206401, partial [Oryza sativa Japonica Group]
AAGSRSPGGVAALPRRGQLVDGGDNDKNKCVYMLYYMGTGWIWKAGTDAAIGVELTAADGSGFAVRDLERWGGLMGAEHDYYERATAASPADRRTSSPRVVAAAASPPRTPPRPVAALPFSRPSITASPAGRRTSLRRRPPPHHRPALHRVQRGVREREEERGRRGEAGLLMWHPDMWGPRGSHDDSAATSDKIGSKPLRDLVCTGFVSWGMRCIRFYG